MPYTKEIPNHPKETIRDYLYANCYGYHNHKPRREILAQLPVKIDERVFRIILQELKLTNDVASLSGKGIWFVPIMTNDKEEIEM